MGRRSTRQQILEVVEALAARPGSAVVFNPYAGKRGAPRRQNLARYLGRLLRRRPPVALIGEAPSWRGGSVSGIPFAAFEDLCAPDLHGILGPWELPLGRDLPLYESSARIVRAASAELGISPVLAWNVFPWHPHPAGEPRRNRLPSARERQEGEAILVTVIRLIRPQRVVAVGRVASQVLAALGVEHASVRHPAHGGAAAFVDGLRRALSS